MILDTLDRLNDYAKSVPALKIIEKFLAEHPLDALEVGRYELDGGVYVMISNSATKVGGAYESHRKYLDLQTPIVGDEIIDYAPLCAVTSSDDYSAEKDCQFHTVPEAGRTSLPMTPGRFAVLYPQDAHRPCQKLTVDTVKKAVFKIPVAE